MGSWFDVLLVLMLVTSIAIGFHQGLLRQAFLLMAIYIGTVLSAQYYGYLSGLLLMAFPSSNSDMTDVLAFLVLMVAFTIMVAWLVFKGISESRLPSIAMVDNLGGATLGGVFGLFAIAITLMIAEYALQVPWPDGSNVRFALFTGLNNSLLSATFSTPLPVFQSALRPWLPANVPFI